MRDLPVALADELNAEVAFIVYLVEFLFEPPIYYTNADLTIYHDGKVYVPRQMDFGALEYSITPEADKISIEIDNADNLVSGWIMTSETRGHTFNLILAALDQNMAVVGAATLFGSGILDRVSARRKTAKIDIFNHMILWKKKVPSRIHQSTCSWSFRDPVTCKYTGAETVCDKSYEQCLQYGNYLNFGGFRWLPDLTDRQIWWGRNQKDTSAETTSGAPR